MAPLNDQSHVLPETPVVHGISAEERKKKQMESTVRRQSFIEEKKAEALRLAESIQTPSSRTSVSSPERKKSMIPSRSNVEIESTTQKRNDSYSKKEKKATVAADLVCFV